MTEPQSKPSQPCDVVGPPRTVSGERPVARVMPPRPEPRRPAQPKRSSPPIEEDSTRASTLPSQEPSNAPVEMASQVAPREAVPQPAVDTSEYDSLWEHSSVSVATPSVATPELELSAARAESAESDEPKTVVQLDYDLDDSKEASAPEQMPRRSSQRRRKLVAGALVLAAGALGALSAVSLHQVKSSNRKPVATIVAKFAASPSTLEIVRERPNLHSNAVAPAIRAGNAEPRAGTGEPRAGIVELGADAVERNAPAGDAVPVDLLVHDGSEQAAPTCEQLLANVPQSTDKRWGFEHLDAARRALVRGDFDGSQRALCQAVRAKNAEANFPFELTQLLLLRRDATAAVLWAEQAKQLEPTTPRVLNALGDALVRTGKSDAARAAWLAAANAPDDRAGIDRLAQQMFEAAEAALKDRDPTRAERFLRRVVALQPQNARPYAAMALTLQKLGLSRSAELWSQRGAALTSAEEAPSR